jgi:hypothetical protein
VQNPLTGVNHFDANLQASGVEHLALPWYVHGGVGGGFSQDYNVLQELANVEAGSLVAPTAVGDDAVRMPLSGTSVRQYILDARDLDWNGSYDRDDDTGRSAAESLSDSILD